MFETTPMTLQILDGMKLHTLIAAIFLHSQGVIRFSEQDVADVIDVTRKSARRYLKSLQVFGLIFHVGSHQKRPWMLNQKGVEQLPLPLNLAIDEGKVYPQPLSYPQSYPQKSESYPQAERDEGKVYPEPVADPYRSDQKKIEEEGGNKCQRHLLREIGVSRKYSDIAASKTPEEILGAWWWLATQTWPNSHIAVFATHLRDDHETPPKFEQFAAWWLAATPPDQEKLKQAVIQSTWTPTKPTGPLPYSFPDELWETAVAVWEAKEFEL